MPPPPHIRRLGGTLIRHSITAPGAPSALPLLSPPPAYRVRGAADGRARRLRQVEKRTVDMLFVRGDGVILVSPPLRTS